MRVTWKVVGAVAALLGVVWTLQGLNLLHGSPMSGKATWVVVGPIVTVLGLLAFVYGGRSRSGA